MCAHIAVAEDNRKQAELLRRYLEREHHSVSIVDNGRDAVALVREVSPDLLVLDLMLPLVDGLEVCRAVRLESDIPVLMLTARNTENDLLLGLEVGADDYMTKPYSPRELVARVRTLLRRSRMSEATRSAPTRVGALEIDALRHRVTLHGDVVQLTPGEFKLLEALAAEPGRVFTRAQLLERTHGFDQFITARAIDVHIRNLRTKLEPNPSDPIYLHTVFGVGYTLAIEPKHVDAT